MAWVHFLWVRLKLSHVERKGGRTAGLRQSWKNAVSVVYSQNVCVCACVVKEVNLNVNWYSLIKNTKFLNQGFLKHKSHQFRSVQSPSHVWLFAIPWTCSTPGFYVLHYFLEFAQTHVHWVGDAFNHLILCHPLLLPSIFPSTRAFSNESALCIRWPKYWSFSISPSSEYSGLTSIRIDWFDLLTVQGTLKSLLQYCSLKASIIRCSDFSIVQLSHPYMTTGKTVVLTRRTFVGKVMSLLFNMLSRWVITFLPRSKCLLIPRLQSPSAVIFEPPLQSKVSHHFHCFPIYLPWSDGSGCHDLNFLVLSFKPAFHSHLSLLSKAF